MLLRLLVLSIILIGIEWAEAMELPSFMRDGSSRFLSRSLGSACYSMDSVERGLPCNPAFVAKSRDPRFDGDLFLGSNVEYLKEAERLLGGTATEADVARIAARRDYAQAEASLEASFQAATWGVSIEPYRLILYSHIENPSLPAVDFIAAEQQSAKAQIASYVSQNFYAGLQLRYTHVRFIGQFFTVSEALAENSQELFEAQTQELIFLEPGFLYAWEDAAWQPQISAVLSQWGVTSHKSEQFPIKPEGLLGASVKPLVPLGLLEVGTQFSVNANTENLRDAIRAAVSYKLGILQAVVSASEFDQSAGFLVGFKNFTSGLSYWNENNERGVFIQFGVTL
ncbi:hypothetical protein [Bdellovibrio svalbardensis]|uniref:SPOR domain-containing protein n=1 Tax=Bdellovibrio svalbardensis TaxID=2972972 RepID=A0ABT6DHB8_9BACT|nr:hypothetical protein [Bdellovibrio svalbardensis]MDG0815867.1 hypothetical protein [Bdellovibrio svalbardensis]